MQAYFGRAKAACFRDKKNSLARRKRLHWGLTGSTDLILILSWMTFNLLVLDRCFYSCLWITPDLWCQKRLWILCFSTTSIKIWRSGAFSPFSPLHLGEPLRKQKVVVCDLWLVDFDLFCVFLCFKVSCFVFEKHRKFYHSFKHFLTSLHWNMAVSYTHLTLPTIYSV